MLPVTEIGKTPLAAHETFVVKVVVSIQVVYVPCGVIVHENVPGDELKSSLNVYAMWLAVVPTMPLAPIGKTPSAAHETLVVNEVVCSQSTLVGVSDIDIVTGFVAKFSLNV